MEFCGHVQETPAVKPHDVEGCEEWRSLEPGEDWAWCYQDELFMEPAPRPE